MTDFTEEETILMNDSLFSCEMLADYHTKLEQPVRQKQMKNYTTKSRYKMKITRKMWKGHQKITVLDARCVLDDMNNMNEKLSMTWKLRRE